MPTAQLFAVACLATVVAAGVDWWAVATRRHGVERLAKPAVLVALLAVAALVGGPPSLLAWVLVALGLGLVGDVLLLEDGEGRFVGGLAAFLLGHLAWVGAFVVLGLDAPARGWLGAAVVLVALAAGRRILPNAARTGGAGLGAAVAAYMLVIGATAVLGWATGSLAIGLGATLFVVSDTVLAVGRFVAERAWTRPTVIVTYHVAQALLLAGTLGVPC